MALIAAAASEAHATSILTVTYTKNATPDPDFDTALASYTGAAPSTQYFTGLVGVTKYSPSNTPASNFTGYIDGNVSTTRALKLFCGEVSQVLKEGTYTYTPLEISNPLTSTYIDLLFSSKYADGISTKERSDAFQLAIWELTYDAPGSSAFTSGTFLAGSPTRAHFPPPATPLDGGPGTENVMSIAQGYINTVAAAYANLANEMISDHVFVLHSDDNQDFFIRENDLFATFPSASVPEPATLAFGLALLGLGASARIRRPKSA